MMNRGRNNPVAWLRWAALIEAVSYLVLLGAAMPLKYFAGIPMAVRVAGSIHGGLFIVFCAALALVLWKARWPGRRAALIFAAALVPVAPFLLDSRMKGYAADFDRARTV